MSTIRVLIVDDAVVVRSRVSKILAADPDLKVVGVAAHGRIALAKIPQVNPDVVILDVEMPEMGGLETLVVIRQIYPHLPVIMFSTSTHAGAAATLEALSLGASDYVTKPQRLGDVEAVTRYIQADLIPKIKVFGMGNKGKAIAPIAYSDLLPIRPCVTPIEIIGIGVSTGGPDALQVLLSALPATLPVPILIVQHMPPVFTTLLAERLAARCPLPVAEATSGVRLQPGQVWIAPGNFHMVVHHQGTTTQLEIHQAPPENSCRPSVDVLFRSIAHAYGARSLAVVLTGMGQDGLRGCQQIRDVGGQVLVQDQASSVVWGMPGLVAAAGLADQVVPLQAMVGEIRRRLG